MNIGADWRISSDAMNVTIEHLVTVISKDKQEHESWQIVGHYNTIQGALQGLIRHEVKATALTDLQTVVARLDKIDKHIQAIPNHVATVLTEERDSELKTKRENKRGMK